MSKIADEAAFYFYRSRSLWKQRDRIYGWPDITWYRHGNPIASKRDGLITINDCGYRSNSTKDRLNSLLQLVPGKYFRAKISQKNYQWFITRTDRTVTKWTGSLVIYGTAEGRLL